jgi:hypothetical protein
MLGSRSVSAGGCRVISLRAWGILAIAAAVLLSPVLAFLLAIAVKIVIVILQDAGVLKFVALVAVGAMGWLMLRKLWVRPRGASVDT